MSGSNNPLIIGLNVADTITTSSGLQASNTFVTISQNNATAGPIGMERQIGSNIAAHMVANVWLDEPSAYDPTMSPINTFQYGIVLTAEQTANVYSILYSALSATYSNVTPVYYSSSN